MTEIKDRIKEFIAHHKLSIRAFEAKCGFSRGMSNSKGEAIGTDKLTIIVTIFPELNLYWLVLGEGEMLITPSSSDIGDDKLIDYLKQKNQELEKEIKTLIRENATLNARLAFHNTETT